MKPRVPPGTLRKMTPSTHRRWRSLAVAGVLVSMLAGAMFTMLVVWVWVLGSPAEQGEETFPAWYTDPFDQSWQVKLAPAAGGGLGTSAMRPIRVCGVSGEQAYLASLLCEDSAAPPPFDDPFVVMDAKREAVQRAFRTRAVDRYEVTCGSDTVTVFLSPYHCDETVTASVPPGFVPRYPAGV